MMGMNTGSITRSAARAAPPRTRALRRSLPRPDLLRVAVLREQPLGEVHALAELAHLRAELLHLTRQLRAERVELRPDVFRKGRTALAPDPLGERSAHGREGEQQERPTPEDKDDGEDPLHISIPSVSHP